MKIHTCGCQSKNFESSASRFSVHEMALLGGGGVRTITASNMVRGSIQTKKNSDWLILEKIQILPETEWTQSLYFWPNFDPTFLPDYCRQGKSLAIENMAKPTAPFPEKYHCFCTIWAILGNK